MAQAAGPHGGPTDPKRGTALILAAGAGTRMRSSRAKVLQPLLGLPMAHFPIQAAVGAGLDVVVVVHHQEEAVRAALGFEGVRFARQEALHGTGDAVASALSSLPESGVAVVLYGDCPLLRKETLSHLVDVHRASAGNLITMITCFVDDPSGYGRLIRDNQGHPVRVVEDRECSPGERTIREVNVGLYAFDVAWLRASLPALKPHPHKNEIFLTDLVEKAGDHGRLAVLHHDDAGEMMGVNDRLQLSHARRLLQDRVLERLAIEGVTFENPLSNVVETQVEIGPDTTIEAGVVLRGRTRIESGVTIGAHSVIIDSEVGEGTEILPHSLLEGARVGPRCQVGPYARLRPEADIGEGAKVGNFVEIKKSVIEPRAKVPHLSYVGDARVGAGANVGAGTITCNYDGFGKHRTEIGKGAFIGSNSSLVAPVRIGDGALVGAGSTITRDVPDDAIAVARGHLDLREDAARRFRARKQAEKDARKEQK